MRSANPSTSALPPVTPNDTHYSQQWGMDKIQMPEAWGNYSTGGITPLGETIVVAVIDDQFDLDHEDLNFWVNNNEIPNDGIDNDNNGYLDDYLGWDVTSPNGDGDPGTTDFTYGSHATLVSGIIGAKGNNNTGVTGVNWNVEILPIRVNHNNITDADAFAAYSYAYTMRSRYNNTFGTRGAFIVATNSSFGQDNSLPSQYPMWCAMYETLGSVGVLSCGAAPNNEVNVEIVGDIPTRCTSGYLIGVTSTNSSDNKVNPAGYGTTSIDIAAPGGHSSTSDEIFSTAGNDTYGSDWGTSFATPHVTGTIALMYAAACEDLMELSNSHPAEVALLMKHFLLSGADQLSSLSGYVAEERRLNALGAIEYLRGVQATPLEPTLQISANTIWSTGQVLFGDLLVKSGYTLTIEDILIMPKDGKITVEKGAKLVVDGGRITTGSPSCIGYWKGIEVIGDPNQSQTAANQGVVELTNGALVEYANTAIYTGANGSGWQGGAIVQADGATFRNNRRAVAFLQYTQSDNLSYFNNCSFEINSDYPQSSYIDMITMWDVRGVDFTDCTFSNTNATVGNEKHAIYTIDANFDVSGISSFSGFEGAVFATNSNTVNSFSVDGANFSDNALGIYAGSVDNIVVTSNAFTVGQFNTSSYNHGLLLEESTGYQVEENQFLGDDQVTGGMDLIGVECQNSGDDHNIIYKNDFSDLYYGAKAYGDNRGYYWWMGLEFICNNHNDNTYDFKVEKDNSISPSLSGISSGQGSYYQSAGNTFSLHTTPTGSDFYNDTPNSVQYNYDNGTNKKPLNIYNINLPSYTSPAHTCSSNLSMMASSSFSEEQFATHQAAYDIAWKGYQDKIDGGNTDALIKEIKSATDKSSKALYGRLLGLSPWVSTSVIQTIFDRSELFTIEELENLIIRNPDLSKEGVLWDQLSNHLPEDKLIMIKTNMAKQPSTERTYIEETLGNHLAEMHIAANALIRNSLTGGEAIDLSTARNWLAEKETLQAAYAIVESWLQEQAPVQALDALEQMKGSYQFDAHQESEYFDYGALTQLKMQAMQSGRTIADFSEDEVLQLVEIANRNNGRAGVQARGILNFFYGYDYTTEQSPATFSEGEKNSFLNLHTDNPAELIGETLISISPNPANEVITFNYNLTDYQDSKVTLQIIDESGRYIKEFVLDPVVGQTQWNTSQLQAGFYVYQLKSQSKIISSGRFLISN